MPSHLSLAILSLVVLISPKAWAATSVKVPSDYATIQQAIDALEADATLADTIEIANGTYQETLTLNGAITLKGSETAATFLKSNNSDAILTLDGASNAVIQNLTFSGTTPGIELINSTGVIISSNVFRLGSGATAINSDTATEAEISNNTFYANNTAIERGSESTRIQNNIFADNTLAIAPSTLTGEISNNCFNNNTNDGPQGSNPITDADALFVSTSLGDFHLKSGSPCIDQGLGTDIIDDSTADLGAYGGSKADVYPFPVQNLVATDVTANMGSSAIELSWSANPSYHIAGYKVYYDSDQPGTPYDGSDALGGSKTSPIDVLSLTSYTLSDLSPRQTAPSVPKISQLSPSSRTIKIEWASVANASKYILHYGVDNTNQTINVGNATQYTLTGLENGTMYQFALSSLYQATYYLSVTAYDNSANANESRLSNEATMALGEAKESALSSVVSAIPEAVVPYPLLADEGCFIATAAYGFYDAPQVQALRDFRDQYLLTNEAGQWLVNTYYHYSPAAAHYIETQPEWKPLIRVALLPAVATSWLLTQASWQAQASAGFGMLGLFLLIHRRKQSLRAAA